MKSKLIVARDTFLIIIAFISPLLFANLTFGYALKIAKGNSWENLILTILFASLPGMLFILITARKKRTKAILMTGIPAISYLMLALLMSMIGDKADPYATAIATDGTYRGAAK
jgi:hypothetical protein